jgi:hypothetical protein
MSVLAMLGWGSREFKSGTIAVRLIEGDGTAFMLF